MTTKNVLVYADKGASTRLVVTTMHALKRNLHSVNVRTIMAQDVCEGGWKDNSVLLVMPGGADIPYCEALNGRGNQQIRDFVKQGGAYLGLCAGAYYASQYVCFGRGSPLHVEGDRELGFFPGIAFGSVAPAFDYTSEAGAQATSVRICAPLVRHPPQPTQAGCYNDTASHSDTSAATQRGAVSTNQEMVSSSSADDLHHSSGVECSNAVLPQDIWLEGSSAHAQAQQASCFLSDRSAEQQATAAARGLGDAGAASVHGDPESGGVQENGTTHASTPGTTAGHVAVAYPVGGTQKQSDGINGSAVESNGREHSEHLRSERKPSSSRPLTQGSSVTDYVNGGCCFLLDRCSCRVQEGETDGELGQGVMVIARYRETDRIAAVMTRPFGEHSGHVVLCGTHPEMPGQLLLAAMHLEPPGSRFKGEGAQLYRRHVAQLHRELLGDSETSNDNESRRESYFRLLLQHAGMDEFLTKCCSSDTNTVVEVQ